MKSHANFLKISYVVMISILFGLNLQTAQSHPSKRRTHNVRSLSEVVSKTDEESVQKKPSMPTLSPEKHAAIEKEMHRIITQLKAMPSVKNKDKPCTNGTCEHLGSFSNLILKPAYPCDVWDHSSRTCFLHRNLGNTVTFVLGEPPTKTVGKMRVEWQQIFRTSDPKHRKTYEINRKDSPWNMVIGSRGQELRVSPITEVDVYPNHFTAVVHYQYGTSIRKLHFIIKKLPISVGLIYPGANMILHIRSFISLPAEGMTFKWELDSRFNILPSNMHPSPTGASLRISELRKQQEGVVACSVFTNLGVQASQVTFSIRQVESDNNKLVFIATRPPHTPVPVWERGRSEKLPKIHKTNKPPEKRELDTTSTIVVNQLDKLSLNELLSRLVGNAYKSNTRNKRSLQFQMDSFDSLGDPKYNEHADTNVNAGYEEVRDLSFMPNHEDDEPWQEPILDPPLNLIEYSDGYQNQMHSAKRRKKSKFGAFDGDEYMDFEKEASDMENPKHSPNRPLRHSQGILANFRGDDQTYLPKIKLHATTETYASLVDVEEDTSLPQLQERDKLAMLLGKCDDDLQCSMNAVCVKRKKEKPGFCQCLPKFEGNGIFCWERGKWMA